MAKKKLKTGTAVVRSVEEIEGAKIFDIAPDYIELNGFIYEKQGRKEDGVNLTLDFDDNTLKIIAEHRKKNPGYMNDQEVIREAIRNSIRDGHLK